VTGVTTYGPPATGFQGSNAERVLRFAAAVPALTRLAILKFQTTDTDDDLAETLSALPATITAHEVWEWSTVPQLQALFNDYQTRKNNGDPTLPNGLLVMADFHNFIQSNRQIIIARANALDLTAMYPAAEFVADGGPRSFGPVMTRLFEDIAAYVCTVLGGKTPPPPPPPPPPKWSTPSAWEELP
jgi:hypothetical protein